MMDQGGVPVAPKVDLGTLILSEILENQRSLAAKIDGVIASAVTRSEHQLAHVELIKKIENAATRDELTIALKNMQMAVASIVPRTEHEVYWAENLTARAAQEKKIQVVEEEVRELAKTQLPSWMSTGMVSAGISSIVAFAAAFATYYFTHPHP